MRGSFAILACAILCAGCAAPPAPADDARDFVLGTLQANGNAGVRFPASSPVLELAPAYFSLDEASRQVVVWNEAVVAGRWLLKLDGFGDAGWAVLPGQIADLRVERGAANATFILSLGEELFTMEQLGNTNPGGPCRGNVTYLGAPRPLGEGGSFWTTRVQPGGNATIELDGPPPCDGLRFAFAHRGTWAARPPP